MLIRCNTPLNVLLLYSLLINACFTIINAITYVPLFHAGNGMYTLEIAMGTPAQPLMVMLDGWSSDVWVPTLQSLGSANLTHLSFNPSISTTYKDLKKQQILPYPHTGGNIVQVAVGSDNFGIQKSHLHTTPNTDNIINKLPVYLGVANKEDPWFIYAPWDGMLGLALDGLAQIDTSSIITRITNEANIPGLFGFYYTQGYGYNGSELTIGGYNNQYFYNTNNIPVFTPILSTSSSNNNIYELWQFRLPYVTLSYTTTNTLDYTSAFDAANMLSLGWTNTNPTNKISSSSYTSIENEIDDNNNMNICANNLLCTGVIDISGGTLGLPISQLADLLAVINATLQGQCIMDHGTLPPPPSPSPKKQIDKHDGLSNIPYLPKYVFCPNNTLSTMPIITYTISTSINTDGNDNSNDLYDLPITADIYCVSSWMDTVATPNGTIPYTHYAPKNMCRLLLSGVTTSLTPNSYDFLLGSPFIQTYYTILDTNNFQVGLTGITNNGPFPSIYTQSTTSFWGSREMWAIIIAVVVCAIIGVGVYVVIRDRMREKRSQEVRDFFRIGLLPNNSFSSRKSSTLSYDNQHDDEHYRQQMIEDEVLHGNEPNNWNNIQYNDDYVPNHYITTNSINNNNTTGSPTTKPNLLQSALYSLRGNTSPSTSFRGIRGSLNASFYNHSNDYNYLHHQQHHQYHNDSQIIDGTFSNNDPQAYTSNSSHHLTAASSSPSSPYYSLRDGLALRTSVGNVQGTTMFFDGQ